MNTLRKIYKKDIPDLMRETAFWDHEFLSISKHRLLAHWHNPNSDNDDIVLVLAYIDDELVGYMGVFTDRITIDAQTQKIGWLSTWWVHPKTKGSGIGRKILDTMYAANNGKIGISQFTPSAKRVYDKSGYFYTLKVNQGIKAVLRSNLVFVLPALYPKTRSLATVFAVTDSILNFFIGMKLAIQKNTLRSKLQNVTIEYLSAIDPQTRELIDRHSTRAISKKSDAFFEWMKAYPWIQESPLLELTNKKKYEFSMADHSFSIYLIKIIEKNICKGFIVLQKRHHVAKLLFAYGDPADAHLAADVIKLQCATQNVREIICYDPAITAELKKSNLFLYQTKKQRESIISKAFGKENFDEVAMNFGDGDCSFA